MMCVYVIQFGSRGHEKLALMSPFKNVLVTCPAMHTFYTCTVGCQYANTIPDNLIYFIHRLFNIVLSYCTTDSMVIHNVS